MSRETLGRFVFYLFYWSVIAPIAFIAALEVLIRPTGLAVTAIWGETPPQAVRIATWVIAAFGFAVAAGAVWWLWRRFRAYIVETLASVQGKM